MCTKQTLQYFIQKSWGDDYTNSPSLMLLTIETRFRMNVNEGGLSSLSDSFTRQSHQSQRAQYFHQVPHPVRDCLIGHNYGS